MLTHSATKHLIYEITALPPFQSPWPRDWSRLSISHNRGRHAAPCSLSHADSGRCKLRRAFRRPWRRRGGWRCWYWHMNMGGFGLVWA